MNIYNHPSHGQKMIPAGYMAKKIVSRPDWLESHIVKDIYSVSSCISENIDYIRFWRHNGFWLLNSLEILDTIIKESGIDAARYCSFYYECYEREFNDSTGTWCPVVPDPSFVTGVKKPAKPQLQGFDVVTFSCGTTPECSPLSCNGLAKKIQTNSYCLLPSLEEAINLIEKGEFANSEPGPFRIFSVSTVV